MTHPICVSSMGHALHTPAANIHRRGNFQYPSPSDTQFAFVLPHSVALRRALQCPVLCDAVLALCYSALHANGVFLSTLFFGVTPVLISPAFAQAAAPAAGGDFMSQISGMLPLVLMFVALYFIMIRPQMKRQKEHRAMIEALAKGDEVVTAGGLLGRVVDLNEQFLFVEVASGVKLQLQRQAITQVLPKGTVK